MYLDDDDCNYMPQFTKLACDLTLFVIFFFEFGFSSNQSKLSILNKQRNTKTRKSTRVCVFALVFDVKVALLYYSHSLRSLLIVS